jgi:hypothetical protein
LKKKIYGVEYCGEDECPNRGQIQRMNKDGETEKRPYCYEKCREIPEEITTPGYEKFPNWCPLEDA